MERPSSTGVMICSQSMNGNMIHFQDPYAGVIAKQSSGNAG